LQAAAGKLSSRQATQGKTGGEEGKGRGGVCVSRGELNGGSEWVERLNFRARTCVSSVGARRASWRTRWTVGVVVVVVVVVVVAAAGREVAGMCRCFRAA
jgi:hypothetical protein